MANAGSLFPGQFRVARVSSLEQIGQEFVKLLRAKGADRLQLARHDSGTALFLSPLCRLLTCSPC